MLLQVHKQCLESSIIKSLFLLKIPRLYTLFELYFVNREILFRVLLQLNLISFKNKAIAWISGACSISLEEVAVATDVIRFFDGMLVHFAFCL